MSWLPALCRTGKGSGFSQLMLRKYPTFCPGGDVKAEDLKSRGGGLLIESSGQGCMVLIQVVIQFSVSREVTLNDYSKTFSCESQQTLIPCGIHTCSTTLTCSMWWDQETKQSSAGPSAHCTPLVGVMQLVRWVTFHYHFFCCLWGPARGPWWVNCLKSETILTHFSVPCKSFDVFSMLFSGHIPQPWWPEQVALGSLRWKPAQLNLGRSDWLLFRRLAAAKRCCLSLHDKSITSGFHSKSFRALQPPLGPSNQSPVYVFTEQAFMSLWHLPGRIENDTPRTETRIGSLPTRQKRELWFLPLLC